MKIGEREERAREREGGREGEGETSTHLIAIDDGPMLLGSKVKVMAVILLMRTRLGSNLV